MNKIFVVAFTITMAALLLTGCGNANPEKDERLIGLWKAVMLDVNRDTVYNVFVNKATGDTTRVPVCRNIMDTYIDQIAFPGVAKFLSWHTESGVLHARYCEPVERCMTSEYLEYADVELAYSITMGRLVLTMKKNDLRPEDGVKILEWCGVDLKKEWPGHVRRKR